MLIKNAMVYRNSERCFERCDVLVNNGIITEVGKSLAAPDEIFDAEGYYIVSGLVDVHTHGRVGYDFLTANNEHLHAMARSYAENGITTVMPTLASAPLEEMLETVERINRFESDVAEAYFCGAHLEGRYLNPEKRGAHAPQMLSALCAEQLESEVFRMCRSLHVSAAYELDTDGSFSKKARELGATLALAHTNATYAEARVAESRGVTAYTHTFNTMPPLHHRDGGAVCAALTGECFAELICDGIHIAPHMIALASRCLGADRTVLVPAFIEGVGGKAEIYERKANFTLASLEAN